MSMPLTTLLSGIQIMLYVGSSLLLVGSLAGLVTKSQIFSLHSILIFSGSAGKPGTRGDQPHEMRRARRVPSNRPIELMNSSGKFVANSARLRDISASGACFESPFILNQGKRIEALLHSSKEGLQRISARIIWIQPKNDRTAYGIEFVHAHRAHS